MGELGWMVGERGYLSDPGKALEGDRVLPRRKEHSQKKTERALLLQKNQDFPSTA